VPTVADVLAQALAESQAQVAGLRAALDQANARIAQLTEQPDPAPTPEP
jgi:hypothetical protein